VKERVDFNAESAEFTEEGERPPTPVSPENREVSA